MNEAKEHAGDDWNWIFLVVDVCQVQVTIDIICEILVADLER